MSNNSKNGKPTKKPSLILLIVCVLLCLGSILLRDSADTDNAAADQTAIVAETVTEDTASVQEAAAEDTASVQEAAAEDTSSVQEAAAADSASVQETAAEDTPSDGDAALQYTFRTENQWESHYQKHGIEMGFADKEAYLKAANLVVNNKDSLHKQEAEDGDDIYYLEETNEFVIVSTDGYIRTYFLPSAGKAYYDRQ